MNITTETFNDLNAPPEKPDPVFNFSDNLNASGFLGATGSFAFADPVQRTGYAHLTRKMGYYGVNDRRETSIREAMYVCIERLENEGN